MGIIDYGVSNGILKNEPNLMSMLKPFLSDFDVTWGARRTAYNTSFYEFIIKPSDIFSEIFGLEYEILLFYTPYDTMQARTMQAISSAFLNDPAKGRVENLVCVIVSDAADSKEWVTRYAIEQQDLRSYVVFTTEELKTARQFSIQAIFRSQLGERDLFDIQLPLLDDLYFFGRQDIIQTLQDNVRNCNNCGVFGLRKTGKTSLLFKLIRVINESCLGRSLLYSANQAKIRYQSWKGLIRLLIKDIGDLYGFGDELPPIEDSIAVAEAFENTIKKIPSDNRLCIIIDEIEYISFKPLLDMHWKRDYFEFWSLLWSVQSRYRNFCFIIAGVNPYVVEISSVEGLQNPLFQIVKPYYLQGLSRDEIRTLSYRIGRRMGMKFDHTAVDYLYNRYAGFPLLVRLALSYENQKAKTKPISFTRERLEQSENARESELTPYCQQILDVLKDSYEDEYTLLEFLSIDDVHDFLELAKSPFAVKHLKNYGLLTYENNMPKIGVPVVANYLRNILSASQGTQLARSVVPKNERKEWVINTTKSIISYIRQLEVAIRSSNSISLYGSNSFPEADKLLDIPVVNNENDFKAYITTMSNCFVESIQNYGKSVNKSNYFWKEIKETYPILFDSLLRIKAYRNWSEHLSLNQQMQEVFDGFFKKDLEGKQIHEVDDAYFVLQQCTSEGMKIAISIEISNLS